MCGSLCKVLSAGLIVTAATCLLGTGTPLWAQDKKERRPARSFPPPVHAWEVATIILGCPTDRQVTMSLTPSRTIEGYVEFGREGDVFFARTRLQAYSNAVPVQLTLDGLLKDTAYHYRFCYRENATSEFQKGPVCTFHTQRPVGKSFVFEVQGDSHPERTPKQNDPALYEQTLLAVARDRPDFYFCMGDDFSVDALREVTSASVEQVYRKQLPYLGIVAQSSPLFLVNGNHEQAARCNLDGSASNVAVWAQLDRNRFFPQPRPDGFYTGDCEPVAPIGDLRDYYAWTWGDALFVVIDPYWHSSVPVDNVFGGDQKHRDLWGITVGEAQYHWLKKTLESSRARFKFVFAHHVNGTGRGGVEKADSYEWGGHGAGGEWEFDQKRPGWALPIHQLMATNGVTIFFQGHDHVFAHQEKDGVVYQTVPEPADPHYTLYNKEAYRSGDVLPNSGRIRVRVASDKARVEYVRSYLPGDVSSGHPDGEVAFSYSVNPDIPACQGTVIAGRPTDQSITLSILLARGARIKVAYGEAGKTLERQTEIVEMKSGEPRQIVLSGLRPDSVCEYRVLEADTAKPLLPGSRNGSFHTCRTPDSAFVFTITADSHLDENSDTELFKQTIENILAAKSDFHIDLGDTFMTGKHKSRETAARQYVAQRYYFGMIGAAMPVFLVIGNHDGEEAAKRDAAGADGLAVWSCLQRKRYFPNPEPDAFYSGNLTRQPYAGLLQDYYAWTWGDALFVVLDPYWASTSSLGGQDPWAMSLGKTQYDWLARTLRASAAKYKFVFIHQLVGGLDRAGRGGAEAVPFYEWGGHEKDGTDTFAVNRPGWEKPIHALLVETGVSIVFHGHDHFFARQKQDGIVYQLVPQPAHGGDSPDQASEYGYREGEFSPSSGFLSVAVTRSSATVNYVRTHGLNCSSEGKFRTDHTKGKP